ncbi:MAG: DJ-1/PfpI family protein [Clostridia bacterium]|nr:DJ-1/PfpI family protein [Clostridia bacterium]
MVYLFLADGFEECEALTPLDILRRGGVTVKTVSIGNEFITGAHGITVKCDILENDILLNEDLEAVILPGGMPGTINLENNQTVRNAVSFAETHGKLICAICAAPKILGGMGLLEGKNATCFPGFEEELKGAVISDKFVVIDSNIITAKGAGVAFEFGFEILAHLKDSETADSLKKQMQCITEV